MIDLAKSEAAIRRFARRVLRRVNLSKINGITLTDIEQECWCAWCKARDSFNAEAGVPFLAYLQRGMQNHINRWLLSFEREHEMAPYSLNHTVNDGDDEVGDKIEVASDEEPVDFLHNELALALMSERARQFVDLLMNPPIDLYRQMDMITQRSQFARQRGLTSTAPVHVTANLVLDLMGADRVERRRIYAELRSLPAEINQC